MTYLFDEAQWLNSGSDSARPDKLFWDRSEDPALPPTINGVGVT